MAAPTSRESGALAGRSAFRPFNRPAIVVVLGAIVLCTVAFASLMYGAVTLSFGQAWSGLTSESDVFARNVVWQIRFPRVVDAMFVGACLAAAGALLQGVTRNPLADPTILGVTAAAGLASAIVIVIDPRVPQWGIAAACAGGGLVGAGILYVIAWRGAVSPVRLALAGVALSAFFGAVIVGLLASSRTFLQTSLGFLAGGMYGSEWRDFRAMLPYALPGLLGAFLLAGRLNVLALGDDVAAGLGVLTDRTRLVVLAVVGILTAAAVSVAGLVSFVGLVCPHLARYSVGNDNRLLIPVAALYGAILVSLADLAARLVISPSEVPMGIITAGIGAPFLLYLVRFRE
ncbi:MAG: iron ABC transporter permease [Chloroflexi bacterium]|nr:iron ABC transporter permease [Dehalococcoidia bacterium]MCO5200163.1 iron ABC transporter permease [Chloroflexota bacterium]MCZ7579044.1 iron ABC transporter permease [Dehalococcoidia bacterium]